MARIYHSIDVHDGIQQYSSKHFVLAWQRNGPREVTRDANEQSDDADNYKKLTGFLVMKVELRMIFLKV